MLTDIFADRYQDKKIWEAFTERESRLLVQCFRILSEQICPYYLDGEEYERGKRFWSDVQRRLSMELGLQSLSALAYAYPSEWMGKKTTISGINTMFRVCEVWMAQPFDGTVTPDRFVKERLSLVEIGFRIREDEISAFEKEIPTKVAARIKLIPSKFGTNLPGNYKDGLNAQLSNMKETFLNSVTELNARFRQGGCCLNYHNGFIQMKTDELVAKQVETPCWQLLSVPKWKNVDTDMKEAIDRRDNGGRDPAFYATRALESAIKIISDEKGWTHGQEKGANSYIENLASKRSNYFLVRWEAEAIKQLFSEVRNPYAHGPGKSEMPSLSEQQTDWVIEVCMSWMKSLIRRL